jgi:hypothetical protein
MVADCRSVQDPEDCRRTESPAGNPCDVYEVRHVNVSDCSPAGATETASLCLENVIGPTTDAGCMGADPSNTRVFYELNGDGTAYLLIKTMCGGSGGPVLNELCSYVGWGTYPEPDEWLYEPAFCSCGGPPPGWPF